MIIDKHTANFSSFVFRFLGTLIVSKYNFYKYSIIHCNTLHTKLYDVFIMENTNFNLLALLSSAEKCELFRVLNWSVNVFYTQFSF